MSPSRLERGLSPRSTTAEPLTYEPSVGAVLCCDADEWDERDEKETVDVGGDCCGSGMVDGSIFEVTLMNFAP